MHWNHTTIATAIMFLTFGLLHYLSYSEEILSIKPFDTFPTKIGNWQGKQEYFDGKIYEMLGVDDSFHANYQREDGNLINLYVGFYRSQREGELIHSPMNCMPGSGWNIIESAIVPLKLDDNQPIRTNINKLVLQNGKKKIISYYWYQSRGRIISSEYMQKIYLVWDAIILNRTDGSFVRLVAPVSLSEEETLLYLEQFARNLFPILKQYIPS